MARTQRDDQPRHSDPLLRQGAANRYDPGGHIAQLQADLARRLSEGSGENPLSSEPFTERLTRLISRTGGYAALLVGYAAMAVLLTHLL